MLVLRFWFEIVLQISDAKVSQEERTSNCLWGGERVPAGNGNVDSVQNCMKEFLLKISTVKFACEGCVACYALCGY